MRRPTQLEAPRRSLEGQIDDAQDILGHELRKMRRVGAVLEERLTDDDFDATRLPPLLRSLAEARRGVACVRDILRASLKAERAKRERAEEPLPQ